MRRAPGSWPAGAAWQRHGRVAVDPGHRIVDVERGVAQPLRRYDRATGSVEHEATRADRGEVIGQQPVQGFRIVGGLGRGPVVDQRDDLCGFVHVPRTPCRRGIQANGTVALSLVRPQRFRAATCRAGLRERKKAQNRQAILDAALGLFAERGFERISVAEDSRGGRRLRGDRLHYFPAKEDLVYSRMEAFEERLLPRP